MRDRVPGAELGRKDQTNLLADGIFIRPVTMRERFIDQRDALRIRAVRRCEIAALL